MSYSLGVDLGTTFTAAAVANGSGPTMIGLGNRALQVPSVLFLDPSGFLVGEAAERRGTIEPDRLVREFKRRLGDHVPLLIGGSPFSAEQLTARLLTWVIATTSERMGEDPATVVLTHPANWGPFKMEVFRQVATLANVSAVSWMPEPVAAAAQYASRARVEPGEKLAIYDLGGGTFDVCLVEKTDDGFRMLGTPDGVEHLGGTDLDHALFERVMAGLSDQLTHLDPDDPDLAIGLTRLRRDCVDAKEALSSDVTAVIPVTLPGLSKTVRITRSEFEELIRPALDETVAATRRGLGSANVQPSEISAIVLIGGSSRIPLVGELLQHEFGVPAALDTHPKHDVALGAARLAQRDGADAHEVAAPPSSKPDAGLRRTTRAQQAASAEATVSAPTEAAEAASVPADLSGAQRQRTPWIRGWPTRSRTRVVAVVVSVVVIAALVVVFGIRALIGSPPRTANTQPSELSAAPPELTSALPQTTGPTPAVPQSVAALSDSVIVWPRVRDGNWDIATIDTATGVEVPLTTAAEEDTGPVISTDRRSVIYSRRGPGGGLRVIGADGKGDRKLFAEQPTGCGGIGRPAWHETTLAIICESTAAPDVSLLSIVALDGTVIRQLDQGTMGDPTFAPNGSAVAYWKDTDSGRGLYVVATDGSSEPVQLTDGKDGVDADPDISPDGKQIAFRRQTSGPRVIMTMPFDGLRATQEPRARTKGPNDQDPSWSPDGKAVAYKYGPDDNGDLWAVDLASGKTAQVVDNPSPDTAPAWSTR